jgi:oxygen-independent coproporphyrinogen-3 oxidase
MVRGLYIHIPFCSHKCPYCDFYSLVGSPVDPAEYVDLVLREASLYREADLKVSTLYLGGGTPSRLRPEDIGRIVEGVCEVLRLGELEEITVECNPEDYGEGDFKRLRSYGVNRLSLGLQSFTPKGLEVLGRKHTVLQGVRAFLMAREAGFENINVDLIYGYPGQELGDLRRDLEFLAQLSPDHVSVYLFTPYEGTPLGERVLRGELEAPGEDRIWELHSALWRTLRDLGYVRYEISNWSKPGKECRHNLIYWTMEEFLGLGVSAWGFLNSVRYGNLRNIKLYAERVRSGLRPVEREFRLTEEDLLEERVMLGLRLRRGVREEMVPDHLLEFFEPAPEGLAIKEEFMILANEIIAELLVYNSIGRR